MIKSITIFVIVVLVCFLYIFLYEVLSKRWRDDPYDKILNMLEETQDKNIDLVDELQSKEFEIIEYKHEIDELKEIISKLDEELKEKEWNQF